MNHSVTAARLLADLDEAIELLGRSGDTHQQAGLRAGREQIVAGNRRGPGHVLSVLNGDETRPSAETRLADRLSDGRYAELRQSMIVGCTELQVFRFRYNSLRIEGPLDDRGVAWTAKTIHQRLVDGDYEGLDLYPGFPLKLGDLAFLSDLQELCLLGIQTKVADDRAAFTLAGLEELALITGCRKPIPECELPVLRRLVLVEREGMECRNWPALEELKVGAWRSGGVDFLSGGTRLRKVELEGEYQSVSLEGIETCERLEVLSATDVALEDLAPLRGLSSLRELGLGSRLKPHRSLDLADITSPALEKLAIGAAAELKNIESLANLPSLHELRLVHPPLTEADRAFLDAMSSRVDVTVFN